MTPIDIQVSRSKVKVKGQALFFICLGRGALVFYKHLYFFKSLTYFSKTLTLVIYNFTTDDPVHFGRPFHGYHDNLS